MLNRPKGKGFSEKHLEIEQQGKASGFQNIWVIIPEDGTLLDEDQLHILYSHLPNPLPSREQTGAFLTCLTTQSGLDEDAIRLHCKEALEENTVILPERKGSLTAILSNVIPFNQFSIDSHLPRVSSLLPLPAADILMQRIQDQWAATIMPEPTEATKQTIEKKNTPKKNKPPLSYTFSSKRKTPCSPLNGKPATAEDNPLYKRTGIQH